MNVNTCKMTPNKHLFKLFIIVYSYNIKTIHILQSHSVILGKSNFVFIFMGITNFAQFIVLFLVVCMNWYKNTKIILIKKLHAMVSYFVDIFNCHCNKMMVTQTWRVYSVEFRNYFIGSVNRWHTMSNVGEQSTNSKLHKQ